MRYLLFFSILALASLETLRFLAPEGITNFGIALAQGCQTYGPRAKTGPLLG